MEVDGWSYTLHNGMVQTGGHMCVPFDSADLQCANLHSQQLAWLAMSMGLQAGHKALHTCTSWYPYAAMFGSSSCFLFFSTYQILHPAFAYFVNTSCLHRTV